MSRIKKLIQRINFPASALPGTEGLDFQAKQGLRSAESEPSVRVRCSFAEDKTGAIGKYSSDRK
ncbi:MAG: hypothetical protein ACE1Z4_04640 [Gammaproteobacteria bacterium]